MVRNTDMTLPILPFAATLPIELCRHFFHYCWFNTLILNSTSLWWKRFLQMHGLLPQFQRFPPLRRAAWPMGLLQWSGDTSRSAKWRDWSPGPGGSETWSWNILAIFEKSREKKTRLQGQGSTSFAQGRLRVENSSTSVEFSGDKKTSDIPVYLQVVPTPIRQ